MSSPIGFDKLFNAKSFDDGTTQIAKYIERITDEITKAEIAADDLTKVMGKQLKAEIAQLSSASQLLTKDMQDMATKMNNFKTATSNTKKVISDYEKENEKLRKELEKLKETQDGVEKSTKKAGSSFKGMAQTMLGVASGAALMYSGIRILKEQLVLAVKSTMEFEQAMKEVQAISRASAEELKLLTENANRLGATTEKTAGEIAKLQKELGKLGFSTTEILASTDAIVDLSTATGEDLANSATIAAATLRAFGLEAIEMNRVVDVMAGSFVRSGLDLSKFAESMKLVAPIARATNIDVETTTAALSKLADAGLSGSLAGTALRNLFSEMADPTSKLVKYLGGLNEEFVNGVNGSDEMVRAFRALRDSGVDLAAAVQMVDVRARPAFFTLMNQVDAVEGLVMEYKDLDGEASRLATTMRDTLTNDVAIASSAFDAARRNLIELFIPALRGTAQELALISETLRFLVDDFSNLDNATNESGKTQIGFWNTLKGLVNLAHEAMVVYTEAAGVDEMKAKMEDVKTTTEQATLSAEKQIDVYVRLKKALANNTHLENLSNEFEKLGVGFETLSNKFADGTITQAEAEKRLVNELERKLGSTKSMLQLQQQSYDQLQIEINALNILKEGENGLSESQNTRLSIALVERNRLREIVKEYASLEETLSKILAKPVIPPFAGLTDEEIQAAKTAKKALEDQLKLEQKIVIERLKGEIEMLKVKEIQETSGATKLEIQTEVAKKELDLLKLTYDNEVAFIDLSVGDTELGQAKKLLAYEEYFNAVNKLMSGKAIEQTAIEVKAIEEINKDILKLKEELFKGLEDLDEQNRKSEEKRSKKDLKDLEEEADKKLAIAELTAEGLSRLATFMFDNRQAERELELQAIDAWQTEQTRLAGDNEDAKLRIEQQAERKRAVIRKKQAEDNKREAMFQIFIDTARAVMAVIAKGGSLGEGIAVGALGIASLAMVSARPVPQFAKGTDDSPEGYAEVGERGRELIKDGKTGRWSLTPNSSTVTYLTKHSQVITNAETERILSQDHNNKADNYLSSNIKQVKPQQIDYSRIGQEVGKHISNIPVNVTNFDQNGVTKYVMGRSSKITRLNKKY
jgi:TP901 family phage tail tape measure protein